LGDLPPLPSAGSPSSGTYTKAAVVAWSGARKRSGKEHGNSICCQLDPFQRQTMRAESADQPDQFVLGLEYIHLAEKLLFAISAKTCQPWLKVVICFIFNKRDKSLFSTMPYNSPYSSLLLHGNIDICHTISSLPTGKFGLNLQLNSDLMLLTKTVALNRIEA
jgi:hypothetical protein